MNKELIVTSEDIKLLKEMKDNCLKSDVYDDEKRLLKANAITKVLYENEKLHHYKTLYQSLKNQKEELRDSLEEKIQYIDTIYLGADRKNYSDDTILDMSSRKWGYKDTLNKLEELEGVNNE